MMKKLLIVPILLLATLSSCNKITPSGKIVSNDRNISGFTSISVESGLNADINIAQSEAVNVTADDNLLEYIETYVINKTLIIRVANNVSFAKHPNIKITVDARSLSALSGSGGAGLTLDYPLDTESFKVALSGGSRLSGRVLANNFTVDLSGGSRVNVEGSCSRLRLTGSGGSTMQGYDINSADANISLSGGSTAELTIYSTLNIDASGGSTLRYKGNAEIQKQELSGGSRVIKE